MRDLSAYTFDGAGCSFLATETEGKSECERRSDDDASEDRLDEFRRDTELIERSENGGYPDRPLGDRTGKIGAMSTSRAGRTGDEALHHFRDDGAEDDDESCNDDLRQEREYDLLEEEGYLSKTEELE